MDVQHHVEPGVPLGDRREKAQRADGGNQERHRDPRHLLQLRRAVEVGRLHDVARDALHEDLDDHHVERVAHGGDDVNPERVHEVELVDQQVTRDEAAVQDHRDHEKDHEAAVPGHVVLREDIPRRDHKQQRGRGADHGAQNGDQKGMEHAALLKHKLIGAKGRVLRKNHEIVVGEQLAFRGQRHADDVDEGEQAEERDNADDDGDDDLIDSFRTRQADAVRIACHIFFPPYQRPRPANLWLSLFEPMIRMKPMNDFSMPTAAP